MMLRHVAAGRRQNSQAGRPRYILQTHYDLEQEGERLAGRLNKEVKVLAAA